MIYIKQKKSRSITAACLAGAIFATTLIASLTSTTVASAFDGDFDSGTFDVWDGTSYDFSWYEGHSSPYTITSAAQLASLSILTNDLTKGFFDWAATLPDSCTPYLETCLNFEGETILLAADIDLNSKEWLPISYVFDTPNITGDKYDALGHVPKRLTTVDPWVGDGNGNEIITRYLELPETEMRYRDLLYGVNFDHPINEGTYSETQLRGISALYHYDTGLNCYDKNTGQVYYLVDNEMVGGGTGTFQAYTVNDIKEKETLRSYTYADIYEYADNKGFNGTFDGAQHRIKNLKPSSHWTEDTALRAHTFDPIGLGLFSILDTDGVIKDVNVRGDIYNVIFSYSAVLCAYNYGLIDNCYIQASMLQSIITSDFPTYRDYGEYDADGNIITPSTYTWSTGTVYPVGNSGYCTAWNVGTIKDCTTAGRVNHVFRQFGFLACTNKGTIIGCTNKGEYYTNSSTNPTKSSPVSDFTTSEFHYSPATISYTEPQPTANVVGHEGQTDIIDPSTYMSIYREAHEAMEAAKDSSFYDAYPGATKQADFYDVHEWLGVRQDAKSAVNMLGYTAAYLQGFNSNATAWVPDNTGVDFGESVVANNIFGIYGLTTIGGISAINDGDIIKCMNEGRVDPICGTSYRGWKSTITNSTREYILPTSPYGIFSTQTDTFTYAGCITALNMGTIQGTINKGTSNRVDLHLYRYGKYLTRPADTAIVFSSNGYYRSDCVVYDNWDSPADMVYNPGGFLWWRSGTVLKDAIITDTFTTYGSYYDSFSAAHYTDYEGNPWTNPYEADEIVNQVTYNYLPCIENMPYPMNHCPYDKVRYINAKNSSPDYGEAWYKEAGPCYAGGTRYDQGVYWVANSSLHQMCAGFTPYNYGDIKAYVEDDGTIVPNEIANTGYIRYAGCIYSVGLDDNVCLLDHIYIKSNKVSGAVVCYYAEDTTITNCIAYESSMSIPSLAKEYVSVHGKDAHISNNINYIGFSLVGIATGAESSRILVSNNVFYSGAPGGYCIFKDSGSYVDVSDIYVFAYNGSTFGAVGNVVYGNLDNIYAYGNVTQCGIGFGRIDDHINNVHYYGYGSQTAIGSFTGGTLYSNIFINTLKDTGQPQAIISGLTASNVAIEHVRFFTLATRELLVGTNCNIKDVLIYSDTPYISSTDSSIFRFQNCTCEDMLLETNVNITWEGLNSSQNLPGLLKAGTDTNTFKNVVVQTPNGCVSYPTQAFMLDEDATIMSDAKLIYDPNARATGAFAYWMDHGDQEDRTYDYTVATTDTYDLYDEHVLEHVDTSHAYLADITGHNIIQLPAYTRKIKDDSETYYLRASAPYTSKGAGELILSVDDQTTKELNEMFPVTSVYFKPHSTVDLTVHENTGFGLSKLYKITSAGMVEEPINKTSATSYTDLTEDIEFIGEWVNTFNITTETVQDVVLNTSASASVLNERINVDLLLTAENKEVSEVYYYNYRLDNNNAWIVDTASKVTIPLNKMYFTMPSNPVMVGCTTVCTKATINKFVLAGTQGTIDTDTNSITVLLQDSVALTSLSPDVFDVTGAKSIYPAVSELQDFSKPVKYSVTAENGDTIDYTVFAYAAADGEISYFDIYGVRGIINQELNTIDVYLSSRLNLKYAKPTILWSGANITPAGVVDLSGLTATYTVTSSTGVDKNYNLTIHNPDGDNEIIDFTATLGNGEPLDFTINHDTKTIVANVPYGTDTSNIIVTNFLYKGLMSNTSNGDIINLSSTYYLLVQDVNGDINKYRVYVIEGVPSVKKISQFALYGRLGVIDEEAKTITVSVPAKYDITNVAPDVVTFTGKSITDAYKKHNWETENVSYVVTAYDGSQVIYTVVVLHD